MGANAAETSTSYALALCQSGRHEEALAIFDQIDIDFPYAHAIRGLAAALCGDNELPITDAAQVWAVDRSSYLDRILADLAAASAEVRSGRAAEAGTRLGRAGDLAVEVGDHVAISLVSSARSRLLPHAEGSSPGAEVAASASAELRSGWRRVIAGLADTAALPVS